MVNSPSSPCSSFSNIWHPLVNLKNSGLLDFTEFCFPRSPPTSMTASLVFFFPKLAFLLLYFRTFQGLLSHHLLFISTDSLSNFFQSHGFKVPSTLKFYTLSLTSSLNSRPIYPMTYLTSPFECLRNTSNLTCLTEFNLCPPPEIHFSCNFSHFIKWQLHLSCSSQKLQSCSWLPSLSHTPHSGHQQVLLRSAYFIYPKTEKITFTNTS